jgi:hypothetical protein
MWYQHNKVKVNNIKHIKVRLCFLIISSYENVSRYYLDKIRFIRMWKYDKMKIFISARLNRSMQRIIRKLPGIYNICLSFQSTRVNSPFLHCLSFQSTWENVSRYYLDKIRFIMMWKYAVFRGRHLKWSFGTLVGSASTCTVSAHHKTTKIVGSNSTYGHTYRTIYQLYCGSQFYLVEETGLSEEYHQTNKRYDIKMCRAYIPHSSILKQFPI